MTLAFSLKFDRTARRFIDGFCLGELGWCAANPLKKCIEGKFSWFVDNKGSGHTVFGAH